MAKEIVQGEVVEVLEDEGPEEGEIEDDTSDEDNVKNDDLGSSSSTQVNTTIAAKYYQPPSTSNSEVRCLKSQSHSEEKVEQSWGNSSRRHYNFYVDHDKPSRDSYNRLKKSDLNSDHRGINFHELLIDYKTSKHGNEGNSHEKENRHFAKEARVEPTRKRENGLNDVPVDKIKRSRKRKHRRSPSRSPVSSETDVGRRKKELRTNRQKRKKKLNSGIRNHSESAALFAQIRASKMNLAANEQNKSAIEVISVASEGENTTEQGEKYLTNSLSIVSDGESGMMEKDNESQISVKDVEYLQEEANKYDGSRYTCSASDTQTAEKVEDSESKDEEDINKLRMEALQSAFRAKFLERKRRGQVVRKHTKKVISNNESNPDNIFNLDDTAELLEAAVEEAVAYCRNKETSPSQDTILPTLCTSLSEVPLPPDDPQVPPTEESPLVEDLTPVDMELALTDEEENTDQLKCDGSEDNFENIETLHPKVRVTRCLSKTRNIPVTIGRNLHFKSRQRASNNGGDNTRRKNLLEVRTCMNEGQTIDESDSNFISMSDVNMGSMIVLDAVGTCSSPEMSQGIEEDPNLSETSDAKSDLVPNYSGQYSMPSNDIDEEDEELLRARLLLDISSKHRKEELISASLNVGDMKGREDNPVNVPTCNLVRTIHTDAVSGGSSIKINGKSSVAPVASVTLGKIKPNSRRYMERLYRQQLLAKVVGKEVSLAKKNVPMTPFVKARLSKICNRGKYQRVNQNRLALVKKHPDGNLQVTVPCSSTNIKVVSQVPQQQDRIVICLGEDSDESDDEKQKSQALGAVQIKSSDTLIETSQPGDSVSAGNISVDFEKSVDLFLKEVRLVQESKSKTSQPEGNDIVGKVETKPLQSVDAKPKVAVKNPKIPPKSTKSVAKQSIGLTQAVRHLPAPQQEEYRRLKMKLSILEEFHKKRKAAGVSQGFLSVDKKNCFIVSGTDSKMIVQNNAKNVSVSKKSDTTKSDSLPKSPALASSFDANREKTSAIVANVEVDKSNNVVGDSGDADDDEDEDENLMREQLLRSRLRKRVAAMASSSKTENVPFKSVTIPSSEESPPTLTETIPSSIMHVTNIMEILPSLVGTLPSNDKTGPSNTETDPAQTNVLLQTKTSPTNIHVPSKTENIPFRADTTFINMENFSTEKDSSNTQAVSAEEEALSFKTDTVFSKIENCSSSAKTIPSKVDTASYKTGSDPALTETITSKAKPVAPATEVVFSNAKVTLERNEATLCNVMVPGRSIGYLTDDILSKVEVCNKKIIPDKKENTHLKNEGSSKTKVIPSLMEGQPKPSKSTCSIIETSAADKKLPDIVKVMDTGEVLASSGTKVDSVKTGPEKIIPANSSASLVSVEMTKSVNSKPKTTVNQESRDPRASQLEELEVQLLMERKAALKYLSELSQLLNKMEMEGNRLKQKEITVRKLKAELALAETALDSQKTFMKQLAMNVSSTHERVTATRQRCTMLSNACLNLGNQLKKDEVAKGGKNVVYKVPMKGAELVKCHLSSVLWQTKQLKKSGLPFFGPTPNLIAKESYPVKKLGKKLTSVQAQSQTAQWVKHIVPPEKLSLLEKKNTTTAPSNFVNTVKTSISPANNNSVVLNTAAEIVCAILPSVGRTSKVPKSTESVQMLPVPSKSFVTSSTNSVTSEQTSHISGNTNSSLDNYTEIESTNTVLVTQDSVSKECSSQISGQANNVPSMSLVMDNAHKISQECASERAICLKDYHSPLEPVSSRKCSEKLAVAVSSGSSEGEDIVMLDPNIILCPYDLMGVCQDEECIYQHQRRKGVVKDS